MEVDDGSQDVGKSEEVVNAILMTQNESTQESQNHSTVEECDKEGQI